MKKAPKLPKQKISDLSKIPSFWESFRYTMGSYAKAGKKLKIDPKILSKLGRQRTRWQKAPNVSDATLDKLQKAIKRMDKRDYVAARQFVYVEPMTGREEFIKGASQAMTPGQRRYAARYAAKGPKQAAYVRKAIRDYYTGKTNTVRMGAISDDGTVYQPTRERYQRVKKVLKKAREAGKRAIRRARRRRNR